MMIPKRILLLLLSFATASGLVAQPLSWESSGIGGGGALFSPSISPHDAREMYLACDMTELFHTTNAGESWEAVPFREVTAVKESQVRFTADPAVLYTIHIDFQPDLRRPLRSTDGGLTWEPITDPAGGEGLYLFADPNGTERLLLSDWCNLYFSEDGGSSFTTVYQNCSDNFYPAGVFWDGERVFVGTNFGLLLSTNGGASFSLAANGGLPPDSGFFSLAGATAGGITRLLATVAPRADIWPTVTGAEFEYSMGIYALEDGAGNAWSPASAGFAADDQPFFVAMAPDNVEVAYAGGGNAATSFPIVYKTTDGGQSWTSIFQTTDNQNINTGWSGYQGDENWWYGEYVLGLAVAPSDPDVVLITDLGFAHTTDDGGAGWRQRYVDPADENAAGSPTPQGRDYRTNGLENTSAWWLQWTSEDEIVAGYSDITGVRSEDGGTSWSFDYEGNSYNSTYQVIRHPNGTLYAAAASVHDLYQSTYLRDNVIDGGDGAVLYSTDEGRNWSVLHDFDRPVIALALDPNDPERLYASVVHSASGGIYTTGNLTAGSASTWSALADPPRTQGHPFLVYVLADGTLVCTYSGRRDGGGAFTASSGCFVSTDGGASWLDRSHPGMHYWTKDIVIDPHDAGQDTWYVGVFSGWGGAPNGLGGIYKTTDRGLSWEKIVDSDRVESLAIHPDDPDIAYFTTEAEGLWYTENFAGDASFVQLTEYPFQHPVRVFFNPYDVNEIWVTSFGHGLRRGLAEPTATVDIGEEAPALDVFPNPTSGEFTVVLPPASGAATYIFALRDLHGRLMRHGKAAAGANPLRLDLSELPSGVYTLQLLDAGRYWGVKVVLE